MTPDLPLFAPRPDVEKEQLRAEVARLRAELAALQPKPKKPKPPFRMTDAHRALLALLSDGEWHLWTELVQPHIGGSRAPGRLNELQAAGLLQYEWRHVQGLRLTEYRAVAR